MQSEKKHVGRLERFQQYRDASCQQFFFFQGNAPKEIIAILTEILGEHAPSYITVKNWVAQINRGRHKRESTPEIIEQIHEIILEDHQISAKSIAEQLGV